jgi:hypothetical protein
VEHFLSFNIEVDNLYKEHKEGPNLCHFLGIGALEPFLVSPEHISQENGKGLSPFILYQTMKTALHTRK